MEMIKAYWKAMRERQHCFSMFCDEFGIIQIVQQKTKCSQRLIIRFGKSLKEFHDETILLSELEERLNSFKSSYQYVFFYNVFGVHLEVLRILNKISLATNCFEPIVVFRNSIIVLPKLRYDDTCLLKYMLMNSESDYRLLWASKARGCEEYV